jgi:hypothetical protein
MQRDPVHQAATGKKDSKVERVTETVRPLRERERPGPQGPLGFRRLRAGYCELLFRLASDRAMRHE